MILHYKVGASSNLSHCATSKPSEMVYPFNIWRVSEATPSIQWKDLLYPWLEMEPTFHFKAIYNSLG